MFTSRSDPPIDSGYPCRQLVFSRQLDFLWPFILSLANSPLQILHGFLIMRPFRPIAEIDGCELVIQTTDDASPTLLDPQTRVAYHSASGAVSETRHVYLDNSGIASRLAGGIKSDVLEVGLGTGLGMLLTLDLAIRHGTTVHYTALENRMLTADILARLELGRPLGRPELARVFIDWRRSLGDTPPPGTYRCELTSAGQLTVEHGDARRWRGATPECFDAIYFDPFAPSVSPELWSREMLRVMHRVLRGSGRIVTYCVSRQVRDEFAAAGFLVQRVPGPRGGKREVLVATKV